MVTTGDPGNQRSFRGNFWVSSVVLGKVGACGDFKSEQSVSE